MLCDDIKMHLMDKRKRMMKGKKKLIEEKKVNWGSELGKGCAKRRREEAADMK